MLINNIDGVTKALNYTNLIIKIQQRIFPSEIRQPNLLGSNDTKPSMISI